MKYISRWKALFDAVEAVQGHRELFGDISASSVAASPNLRVNGDESRRLSNQSSHSDASCPMDILSASSFGIVTLH